MVTLTPGSVSLDLSADKKFLIIHAMFAKNPAVLIASIKIILRKNS